MKNKYRIITLFIMAIIFSVVISSYLLSYKKIGYIYSEQTREVIFDLKKSFLRDTVNNLIYEIDKTKETKKANYEKNVKVKYNTLSSHTYSSNSELINFFIDQFKNASNPDLWTVFLWNNSENKVIYDPKDLYKDNIDITLDLLKNELATYDIISYGEITGIFGVSKSYIEKSIKSEITEKIRSLSFEQDSYIWINEIINYEGGENYAIRRVHPNLPETEGMYLSTDMTDVKGALPYLEELEGVKKSGELFYTYYFKKLRSDVISEKLTYAKLYKDYDWIIAMGVHLDDVQATIDKANIESKELATKYIIKLITFLMGSLILFFILLTLLEKRHFLDSTRVLESNINQDALTKAISRRGGTNALVAAFKDYKTNEMSPAIMIFDIDNFKGINDKYGHDVGDIVLTQVVQVTYNVIRNSDKLIRWGGDEFVGIFYGLKQENTIDLGNKILLAVSALQVSIGSEVISPTVSIGFSYFKESDEDFNAALKRADEALYKSKAEGRNKANIIL